MLALRSGARLGNYKLVRMIGSGGMGAVYQARHESLGRNVAIKIIHALVSGAPKGAVLRARFLREGRAAAQVRHAHIVDVFDFGVQDDTLFLVIELVEGESLADESPASASCLWPRRWRSSFRFCRRSASCMRPGLFTGT
jgi:serine/threonine protein kinase